MKVAITTSSFAQFSDEPLEMLRRAGVEYLLNPHGRKLTEAEALEMLAGCVGVVAGTEPLTAEVIGALSGLKVISRCGVGMDNVDCAAAQTCGIGVCNTPFGPTLAVAELVLGLALNLLRNVNLMDRELRAGTWKKRMGANLAGKRLGVVGMGRIGSAVAAAFVPHDVEVAYCDPGVEDAPFARMDLEELLAWADIVSLNCSAPAGGGPLLDRRLLGLMRPGAWLINCARGGLVDEGALREALIEGALAGAALDVFEREPYQGELAGLDNVILTPHIGSYARESRVRMEVDAVRNLLSGLGLG